MDYLVLKMDYEKLLTSSTLKILRVFKKEKLYFNQIAELTHMKSRSNLLTALNRLVITNVLKRTETKGNTFYSLNYDSGITIALLQLLCTFRLYNLPFERRKALEEIIQSTSPYILFLFGSTAKGTFSKESDLDVLFVHADKGGVQEVQRVKTIGRTYGITINPVYIHVRELEHPNDSLRHILETGYLVAGHFHFYGIIKRT